MACGEPVGLRGRPWDAVVWRIGSLPRIAEAIEEVVSCFNSRLAGIEFPAEMKEHGMPYTRIMIGLEGLQSLASMLKQISKDPGEQNDYHWMLIGDFVMIVDGLLTRLELQS